MDEGNRHFSFLDEVQLLFFFFFYFLSGGFLAGGSLLAGILDAFFPVPLEGTGRRDVECLPVPLWGPERDEVEGTTSMASSAGAERAGGCTASGAGARAVGCGCAGCCTGGDWARARSAELNCVPTDARGGPAPRRATSAKVPFCTNEKRLRAS